MPHTSRKKNLQRSKRTEITDEDGWTRVTTTNSSQRAPRPLPAQQALTDHCSETSVPYPKCVVPEDKTYEQVEAQYRKIEKQWRESDANKKLATVLENESDLTLLRDIDRCVLFGSGSFSGLLLDWIDRSHISMYQLAAFLSIVDTIERVTSRRPKAFAQEPIYTTLDTEFLSHLNITTVETPAGFEELTTASFAYAPGAEQDVTLRILASNPAIIIQNGKLDRYWRNEKGEACTDTTYLYNKRDANNLTAKEEDDYTKDMDKSGLGLNSHKLPDEQPVVKQDLHGPRSSKDDIEQALQIMEDFRKGKCVKRLPSLDVKDQPFHNMHIYYKQP